MNPETIIQTAGTPAVGCSALLGIVLSPTTVIILRTLQGIAAIFCVVCIVMMFKSLMPTKYQNNLNDADKNKCNGQANKQTSKTLQLCRRLRLLLGNRKINFRHQRSLVSVSNSTAFEGVNLVDEFPDNLSGGVIHKSKSVTMPNEPSSATATTNAAAASKKPKI